MVDLFLTIFDFFLNLFVQLMQFFKSNFEILSTFNTLFLPRHHRVLFIVNILKSFDLFCFESGMNWNFTQKINAVIKFLNETFIFNLIIIDSFLNGVDFCFQLIIIGIEVFEAHVNWWDLNLIFIHYFLILLYTFS